MKIWDTTRRFFWDYLDFDVDSNRNPWESLWFFFFSLSLAVIVLIHWICAWIAVVIVRWWWFFGESLRTNTKSTSILFNLWFWQLRVYTWSCELLVFSVKLKWFWWLWRFCGVEFGAIWRMWWRIERIRVRRRWSSAKFLMNFKELLQVLEPWSNWQERENSDVFVWVGRKKNGSLDFDW